MASKSDKVNLNVIAHLIARAMGIKDLCVLVLTNGDRVPGPFVSLKADKRIKTSKRVSSLTVTNADGREVLINDIMGVTLADGSELPPAVGNFGVGEYRDPGRLKR